MTDITKLTGYMKKIEQLEKDIQKKEGMLQSNIDSLCEELDIKDPKSPKKLIAEVKKRTKALEIKIEKNEVIFEELMSEISEVMDNYEQD